MPSPGPLRLAIALLALSAPAERAHCALQTPTGGRPAVSVDAPPGWRTAYDDLGELRLTAPDRSAVIVVSLERLDIFDASATDTLARAYLRNAGARVVPVHAPGALGPMPADIYRSGLVSPRGDELDLTLFVARIDRGHAAVASVIGLEGRSRAQAGAVDAVLASVRAVDAAPPGSPGRP